MCTDVDRNDKSRVCEPGSVKVIGRRLIERYAGLFHTVDHVEGILARASIRSTRSSATCGPSP
jgi:anthranilate synthase